MAFYFKYAKPQEVFVRSVDSGGGSHGNKRKEDAIRQRRNELLARCDWTQMSDASLPGPLRALWAEYRQLLRDVPGQTGFPEVVIWPEMVE